MLPSNVPSSSSPKLSVSLSNQSTASDSQQRPALPLAAHPRFHHARSSIGNSHHSFSLSPSSTSRSTLPDPLHFHNLANTVLKSRQGSVLSRGSLLKTDHYASGRAQALTHHLQGAPNFRSAAYNTFGTAQPTLSGIKTVLAFLKSNPSGKGNSVWFCTREEPVIYISARPFVLRDSVRPTQSVATSDRAQNIEAIELRLKLDVLKESQKYGGLVLVHDETVEGDILPTWITADDVKTTREVWEGVKREGFHVEYHRIPIASDQAPEDSYLDRYVAILRTIPTSTNLIFNCGMGVVRTTFAIAAAIVMRRRQVIKEGGEDLFGLEGDKTPAPASASQAHFPNSQTGDGCSGFKAIKALRILGEQQIRTKSLLTLMQLLQRSLPTANQHSVLELLMSQPNLLENLRKGISGEFDIVMALVSILDQGSLEKDLVDMVIDHCDDVINIRDDILEHRIKFAITATSSEAPLTVAEDATGNNSTHLRRALAGLERYFFLIAFAGYCNEPPMSFRDTFSPWLKTRSEISNMILRLRRTARQFIFAPLHDLTALSKSHVGTIASTAAMKLKFNDLERAGGEVVGTEWVHHIVDTRRGITLRAGLILKSDQWPTQFDADDRNVPGALNFRKVPGTALFGLSQPTQEGIKRVLDDVREKTGNPQRLTWINLREEPLIYINGVPYVLRLEAVGLRNMKSYAGISSGRLELLEDRLKSDILAELRSFDGRVLLHTETDDGLVIGVWETATPSAVKTLREIMDEQSESLAEVCRLDFRRQPITAEKAPDFEDIKDLIGIVSDAEPDAPFIVNCQLGRGRSTLTMVCILLIQQWLAHGGGRFAFAETRTRKRGRRSYQTINNLIRVMRNGRGIKTAVDAAIEKCSAVYDLIDSIEACRVAAEQCEEESVDREHKTKKGLSNLRRYAFVLIFTCYLNETKADTWRDLQNSKSFEAFWKQHQVFKTILDELNGADVQALTPLELGNFTSHGVDWTEEEQTVVARRAGIILSAQTILKSDFFVGLQKMTLPMRVEGLPNIRQVSICLDGDPMADVPSIYGSGMPTVDGLRRGLEKMGAMGPGGRMVYWTSMREEPVLYVRGRPHVLRLFDQPLENVVTTGVAAAAVEGMESALKSDVLNELKEREGRLLLHDEVEENGKFTITAVWETAEEAEIMTPREVFNLMKSEGFQVDYARLPVTDEQAPIPGVFSRLEHRVSQALEWAGHEGIGVNLVFNCQMGRGRTTTGMVAAMLVANVMVPQVSKKEGQAVKSLLTREGSLFDEEGDDEEVEGGSIAGDTWDVGEVNPYLQGEYKIILQLVRVLQFGRLAKKLTDKAIDKMESVQNLRKAVYDFKVRAEAAEPGSEKQRKIIIAATNYLFRYGSLIAFSNWLLERQKGREESIDDKDDNDHQKGKTGSRENDDAEITINQTFPEWLSEHREVLHILQKRSLE